MAHDLEDRQSPAGDPFGEFLDDSESDSEGFGPCELPLDDRAAVVIDTGIAHSSTIHTAAPAPDRAGYWNVGMIIRIYSNTGL